MEIKTEADSNVIMVCPQTGGLSTGMLGLLTVFMYHMNSFIIKLTIASKGHICPVYDHSHVLL